MQGCLTVSCHLSLATARPNSLGALRAPGDVDLTYPILRADIKVPQYLLRQAKVLLVHPPGQARVLNTLPVPLDLYITDFLRPRLHLRLLFYWLLVFWRLSLLDQLFRQLFRKLVNLDFLPGGLFDLGARGG